MLGLQVQQGFSMPAGQLLGLDDQPQCQDSGLGRGSPGYFPGHSILPFPVAMPVAQPQPHHHMNPQVTAQTPTRSCHVSCSCLRAAWLHTLYADTVPPDSAVILSLMLINTDSYTIAILGMHFVASCMLHENTCVPNSQMHFVAADCCRHTSLCCSTVSGMHS